jgi:S-formylglutathione hydrolase FrmB
VWLFPGGAASITVKSRVAVAGGTLIRFTHHSVSTQTPMTAAVFIPPGVEYSAQVLVALTPRHLFCNTHMAYYPSSLPLAPWAVADARGHAQVPAIYWLSGLTCTDENFSQKAGAFAHAAREKV